MLKPLNDNIVIELDKPADTTPGGIALPENRRQDRNGRRGKVLAVGPGRLNEDGIRLPLALKASQTVLLGRGGHEVEVEGKTYHVFREDEVLAVLGD